MKFETVIGASVAASGAVALSKPGEFFLSQESNDGYNALKYLGGMGPYVQGPSVGLSRDPPAQCVVDQVILIHRHSERFPDASAGQNPYSSTLQKLDAANLPTNGSLGFYKDWSFFVPTPNVYSLETFEGPYSGLLDAFQRGTLYRERYGNLWDGQSIVPIWTSGYERVLQTAQKFGEGFFAWNYTNSVAMNIIPETADQGANSLTPACPGQFASAGCNATSPSVENLDKIHPLAAEAAARLNAEYAGLNLTSSDVYSLQQFAGFELNTKSWSPWFDVFTDAEWVSFENYRDLTYYYCNGPGWNGAIAEGTPFANASLALFKEGPEKSHPLAFTFTHDTNITPVLAALGLLLPTSHLPINGKVDFHQPWRGTNIVPMGGHLTLERLTCNATHLYKEGTYVRAVVNEAVVPFQECQDGPSYTCSLKQFENKIVNQYGKDYVRTCKIPKSWPQYLDFFWNFNTTQIYNEYPSVIPYQFQATPF